MKKVALHNLGCKVNAYETDSMKQQLREAGYEIVPFREGADIYIVNTCTVTNIADRKSRQMLHRAKKLNAEAIVVATGCYVQSAGEDMAVDACIDVIVGNNRKGKIVEAIQAYEAERRASFIVDINDAECAYENLSVSEITGHTRAYIKIQDGCNHFCHYCIIPFARGRVRSRSADSVLTEVRALAAGGVREIVLTGIQLSAYGQDFHRRGTALIELTEDLARIPGIERIRLGSLEPTVITEDFVRRLAAIPQFCPHFHLSLQSGSDSVLKRMNRHYTTARYQSACDLLRAVFDDPAITTDIIVGYPGETAEEFAATVHFVRTIGLAQTHVFKYSKRKGTRAATMPNQVDETEKGRRSTKLIEVCKKLEYNYSSRSIGQREMVLLEEHGRLNGEPVTYGYTARYRRVAVPGHVPTNEMIETSIRGMDDDSCILIGE
ncbi:MAG: tRNA (N(6)-L-threonylcarbamoyladenosine(37)-C(2))-methylthiotransferase MtaB [Eubacteriales bacterium]|nr:tRNA (N(6)-L-threonylcarbamoyladenosine(37)-C(2))-methylthiotransferase MtaB [Eubacteriales bacterium]